MIRLERPAQYSTQNLPFSVGSVPHMVLRGDPIFSMSRRKWSPSLRQTELFCDPLRVHNYIHLGPLTMKTCKLITLALLALILGACGGSSSSNGSTTPPTTTLPTDLTAAGKLTGFGSIYVNGIEFETNSATYEIDDVQGSGDSDLSVGMFVKVKGTVNADGVSGTAESVSYDDEVEGPVENIMPDPANGATERTFTVFGGAVLVNTETVFEAEDGSAFGLDTIANGDNVEISGDYHGDVYWASYVELQDAADDDYEVKGTITEIIDAEHFTLTLDHGTMLNVTLDPAGFEIPSVGLMLEQFVEVEGTIPDPASPNDILATKVELEDDDYFDDEDDEVEIKGTLTYNTNDEADPNDDTWTINNYTVVVFGESTVYEPASLGDAIADLSASGREVEVEGHYVDGVLFADEVEDEEDDIEIKALVFAVAPTEGKVGTITVSFPGTSGGKDNAGQLDVLVDGSTFYMDDDAVTPFDLMDLVPGVTYIEFHAHKNADGAIVASSLEIEDSMEVEIEGMVDAVGDVTITVLSIVFNTNDMTDYPNGMPVMEDYVSLKDSNADGTADIVELDD